MYLTPDYLNDLIWKDFFFLKYSGKQLPFNICNSMSVAPFHKGMRYYSFHLQFLLLGWEMPFVYMENIPRSIYGDSFRVGFSKACRVSK